MCACTICVEKGCLRALGSSCVFACATFSACVLWKCSNLAGFARVEAGSLIMAPAPRAGRTHFKEQQVEKAMLYSFTSTVGLSSSLALSASLEWEMATAQIGKGSGRFGKLLFSPLTLSQPSLRVVIDWREVTFKMKSRSVRKNVKAFMLSHGININPHPVSPLSLCLLSTYVAFPFLHCLSGSVALLFLYRCSPWAALALAALCLLLDCLSVCVCVCVCVLEY